MADGRLSLGRVLVAWPLLALFSVALAGCLGDDDAATEISDGIPNDPGDAEVTATTGAIDGAVTSDLFEPLAGAVVTIVETGVTSKVSRNGEFVINDIEAGVYQLMATADGYLSGTRSVQVKEGEVTRVMIQLGVEPSQAPWSEEIQQTGLLVLGHRYHVEVNGECMEVEYPVVTCDGRTLNGINAVMERNITEDTETHVWEVFWTSAGPVGQYFYIDVFCQDIELQSGGRFWGEHPCYVAFPDKESPLSVRMDKAHAVDNDYTWAGDWTSRVYSGYGMLGTYGLAGADAGVAYNQAFTYIVSLFHGAPAPEGYTAIPEE